LLLVIVGAGASFDSIPSRPTGGVAGPNEPFRPPLADHLFQPRPLFEEIQRHVPQVLQIAATLLEPPSGQSVEDVLGDYASLGAEYPPGAIQLAAVRYYIQGVIDLCERGWYRDLPVATNLMALIDRAERFRGRDERPIFVTFNYDRLIEHALENRGQSFSAMTDYILPNAIRVFKLHGSVDWARRIQRMDNSRFGGSVWEIAKQIADQIATLPAAGEIQRWRGAAPSSLADSYILLPAITIPVKAKSKFECPDEHIASLRTALKDVKTVLTIGWRGAERHFLGLLRECGLQDLDVICVAKGPRGAEETRENLMAAGITGQFELYNDGFSKFVAERKADRLFRITWR
jgi:hypothetical protein